MWRWSARSGRKTTDSSSVAAMTPHREHARGREDPSGTVQAKLSARVYGLVQGVFFRAFVRRQAESLGLAGYARNLPDGSVEVEAEGERDKLERLLGALRKGPPQARVDGVDVRWSDCEGRFSGFDTL